MFWGFEIILTNIPMRKHIMHDIGEYHMCEISYNGRWVKLKIKMSRKFFVRVIILPVIVELINVIKLFRLLLPMWILRHNCRVLKQFRRTHFYDTIFRISILTICPQINSYGLSQIYPSRKNYAKYTTSKCSLKYTILLKYKRIWERKNVKIIVMKDIFCESLIA